MIILAVSFALYLLALWKRPLLYIGLVLQVAYIISRGVQLERLPLVGPHDTLVFLAASIAAFSIPFGFLLKDKKRFFDIAAISAGILTVFVMLSKQHNSPLPPVLKTFWFECHVVLAFMSYALFGIAAILGFIYLNQSCRQIDTEKPISAGAGFKPAPTNAGEAESEKFPQESREHAVEGLMYRAALIGYCLFSLSMIFGGIWAYLAWGTYWMWTPKELWTSILWGFYSFYLHARLRQRWIGRPMAYLAIAGFAITMFTYLGVSLLMKSSHSF
ncbi:MAG: cytochrome c biogenesis protein CcsA [Nitrospirae bacterium]|nr:cytochrome c biogenesis protein CcsA [Nitrospirota bacterium]